MKYFSCLTAAAVVLTSLSATAFAEDSVVQAVQIDHEYVRYEKGVPTVDREGQHGVVQIHPLPMDHGSYVFAVTVFNASSLPANIDIGNVAVANGEEPVGVMDVNRLIKKAKNRSFWSQFGVALLGGLASGAAASQRDTSYSSLHTPYGSYHSYFSTPSIAGQFQAARIEDETMYTIGGMQAQLDATRDALSDQVMQLSTVDPGKAYSGKVVLEKFKVKKLPQQLSVVVDWNGEQYPFAFQLAKSGTPAPSYTQLAQADRPSTAVAASPVRRSIGRYPVLPEAEMAAIVQRAAQAMPNGFALDSGTKLSGYSASGTALTFTADADPSIYRDAANWQPAALSEICSARPFQAILLQGGDVKATYRGAAKKELGTLDVTGEACA